jgi:hypothetical protein
MKECDSAPLKTSTILFLPMVLALNNWKDETLAYSTWFLPKLSKQMFPDTSGQAPMFRQSTARSAFYLAPNRPLAACSASMRSRCCAWWDITQNEPAD